MEAWILSITCFLHQIFIWPLVLVSQNCLPECQIADTVSHSSKTGKWTITYQMPLKLVIIFRACKDQIIFSQLLRQPQKNSTPFPNLTS